MSTIEHETVGLGWHQDLPDPRDYTPRQEEVARQLATLRPVIHASEADLRDFFVDVPDQRGLNTSTAHACLGLLQYHLLRAHGRILHPSEFFIYKLARKLLGWEGDSGAQLRHTLKAIVRFGVPPRHIWPPEPAQWDAEPDAFVYGSSDGFGGIRYIRLDNRVHTCEETLRVVKSFLAAGFPCAFGFCATSSLTADPDIAFPRVSNEVLGGQAVVAVGYDDGRRILSDKGALLIRNSWGRHWGEDGFGWLPYTYVRRAMASDFWTVLSQEWLTTGDYLRPL